ncbi:MAG: hypothetical protein Q9204_005348 [Flavoplaca sp. TL-2023a]
MATRFSQMRYRFMFSALILVAILTLIKQRSKLAGAFSSQAGVNLHGILQTTSKNLNECSSTRPPTGSNGAVNHLLQSIATTSNYFIDYPLPASEFAKMGKRLQVLRDWIEACQSLRHQITPEQANTLHNHIDDTVLASLPFLRNPTKPSASSISHLRESFRPESRGILIPTGQKTFRYACHLISNLRDALDSRLPIEVVYAGDSELPSSHRDFISSLGSEITTVDILQVFNDTTLDLQPGGWAIKTFAALGSQYEQVLVLDADAVLLQAPETILDRHQGEALSKSHVYNEGYAEECDSGLVVLDKSRLPILLGLMHACWQNTKEVRDAWTYVMGHGDKESWWFGFELSGAKYTFEDHYGGMLGSMDADNARVCSFTIAHFDEKDKLLWYNGSLLKNKLVNATEFDIPTHYMLDGVWEKGAAKKDMSCMKGGKLKEVSKEEREILRSSVEKAKDLDARMEHIVTSED